MHPVLTPQIAQSLSVLIAAGRVAVLADRAEIEVKGVEPGSRLKRLRANPLLLTSNLISKKSFSRLRVRNGLFA